MGDEDLRDLFAGMALQGLLSRASSIPNLNSLAKSSYLLADLMIDERNRIRADDAFEESGITAVKRKRKTTKEE